jgi:hypothetical protein
MRRLIGGSQQLMLASSSSASTHQLMIDRVLPL